MVCNKPHITLLNPKYFIMASYVGHLGFIPNNGQPALLFFSEFIFTILRSIIVFFYGLLEQNHDKNNLRKEEFLGSQLQGMFGPGLEVLTLELGHLVTSHLQLGSRDW